MTPFVFDTLSASKQLREAGMAEGVAEAVVSVFQHALAMPDISHLATKADLDAQGAATKADLDALRVATKTDLDTLRLATKADLDALRMATKADLETQGVALKADIDLMKADIGTLRRDMATKTDIADLRAEVTDKLRQQGWLLLGGIGAMLTIFTVAGRAFS